MTEGLALIASDQARRNTKPLFKRSLLGCTRVVLLTKSILILIQETQIFRATVLKVHIVLIRQFLAYACIV